MNRIYEEARQLPIFGGEKPFRTEKPIRLIELFAGYGSQALALKYLGVHFEHWKISEWAVKSISAYKDLHFGKDETDYSAGLTAEQIKEWLVGRISADYSTPMTEKQIAKLPEKQARKIYGNMQATHNLGSITKMRGEDLQITDTDRYEYIMTYSFPCQDLSNAGKGAGMGRNSETRSGLLWEVERLLKETQNLPQILLMENVPEVIGKKNIKHFSEWIGFLDSLGYKSKWNLLNAKNFGIPQNRNRCFMVSILGDYYYEMPDGFALDYVLRDFLDYGVDEGYYISDKAVRTLELHKERNAARGNSFGWNPTFGGGTAHTIKTEGGYRPDSNFIIEREGQNHRENRNDDGKHNNGSGLQKLRQSGNECGSGVPRADGITLGKSRSFARAPMPDICRAIDTRGTNGAVEWKN